MAPQYGQSRRSPSSTPSLVPSLPARTILVFHINPCHPAHWPCCGMFRAAAPVMYLPPCGVFGIRLHHVSVGSVGMRGSPSRMTSISFRSMSFPVSWFLPAGPLHRDCASCCRWSCACVRSATLTTPSSTVSRACACNAGWAFRPPPLGSPHRCVGHLPARPPLTASTMSSSVPTPRSSRCMTPCADCFRTSCRPSSSSAVRFGFRTRARDFGLGRRCVVG